MIDDLVAQAKSYKAQLDAGDITQAEFKDLIASLDIAQSFKDNADQFEQNQEAREYLLDLMNLAGAISSL